MNSQKPNNETPDNSVLPSLDPKEWEKINIQDINDEKMGELVRYLINPGKRWSTTAAYTEDELLREIIKLTRHDLESANAIYRKMVGLGLQLCRKEMSEMEWLVMSTDKWLVTPNDKGPRYELQRFAELRGYL